MVEVVTTDEFADWYQGLDEPDTEAVNRSVRRLEQGASPLASRTQAPSATRGMRSVSFGCSAVAGLFVSSYAFDPRRQAVLLIGGDKRGDDRFCEQMVPRADDIFDAYLAEQAAGVHPGPADEED